MSKGGSEERITCKELSVWWSGESDSSLFWRTQGSGGRATMRRKNNIIKEEDFGDVKSDHESTHHFCGFFCIEVKTGYARKTKRKNKSKEIVNNVTQWSLIDLMDSGIKEPMFLSFWKQNERDAEFAKKEPLVIFRRDRRKKCIALYKDIFEAIEKEYGEFKGTKISIQHSAFKTEVIVLNFNEFLEKYSLGKDIFSISFITKALNPIFQNRGKESKIQNNKRRNLKCLN